MAKNTVTLSASTIVVISGEAIIAGSSLQAFASIGSIQPKDCARHTVNIRALLVVMAS